MKNLKSGCERIRGVRLMIKPGAIFKNGMILQRNSVVSIFGETDCEHIKITFCGDIYNADVSDGRWMASIPTGENTEALSMIIKGDESAECDNEIVIENILLGEVWLAGGQSNMELELQNSENGSEVMTEADYERIRFYNVPKCSCVDEELLKCESNTSWRCVRSGSCADMSAVAYYFATRLYESLNVPIGIIDCYWGGTSATCWVNQDDLTDVSEVREYLADWAEVTNGKSDEMYEKELEEFNRVFNKWQDDVNKLKKDEPDIEWTRINQILGDCPWPPPRGRKSPFRPYGLYESMIKRVAPYKVRGVIYYQGEEDAERAAFYSKLNEVVIRRWRKDFDDPEMPFYIMQLPMFISNNAVDDGTWGVLRLEQDKCSTENENVGIAVIDDCGEFDNIHPIDKKTPGCRLAEQVLACTYKMNGYYMNMKAATANFVNNLCEIELTNTYGELHYRRSDGQKLTAKGEDVVIENGAIGRNTIFGFEVINEKGDKYQPDIEAQGDTIRLIGRSGDELKSAQYAMFNYGVANVYSRHGLPLMPFDFKKTDEPDK